MYLQAPDALACIQICSEFGGLRGFALTDPTLASSSLAEAFRRKDLLCISRQVKV